MRSIVIYFGRFYSVLLSTFELHSASYHEHRLQAGIKISMPLRKALIVKSRRVLAIAAIFPELARYQILSLVPTISISSLVPCGPMHDVALDPSSAPQYLKPGRHLEVRLLPPHAIALGSHDVFFLFIYLVILSSF